MPVRSLMSRPEASRFVNPARSASVISPVDLFNASRSAASRFVSGIVTDEGKIVNTASLWSVMLASVESVILIMQFVEDTFGTVHA